ncbi:DUF2510 domain-containing protein [Glaciihabitans arcticus]|uniref:DUF2510 domain-containing protein n=1 Tax=Glaciihabitans arcticus TaxID=2668039 RepID=UPI001F024B34|nr:DUF2510 domain-containing protein [Glaciihabitans arcticus]
MSQDDLFGAPAGWYPDPLGLPQLRWWNNHAWTEQTSAARQPMVMQDTKFAWADDELPTRREERERERARDDREPVKTVAPTAETLRELEPPRAFTKIDEPDPIASIFDAAPAGAPFGAAAPAADVFETPASPEPAAATAQSLYTPDAEAEHVVKLTPSFGSLFDSSSAASPLLMAATENSLDNLFGTKTDRRAARARTPIVTAELLNMEATGAKARVSSGPAWMIAMVPLFQLVLSLLFLTAFGMGSNLAVFVGILVVPYFIVIGLAFADHRALSRAGHDRPAHWGWAALTAPVYLLMRARASIRETGHGIGPVLVWFGLGALHIASAVAIPGLIIALLPAMFSSQIEQSVADDAFLISRSAMTVDCPPSPPLLISESVTCKGTATASGQKYDIKVSLERKNGWVSWQVTDWGVWGMSN